MTKFKPNGGDISTETMIGGGSQAIGADQYLGGGFIGDPGSAGISTETMIGDGGSAI